MQSLLDALTINNLNLRNRLVLPPLTINCATAGGLITDAVVDFYDQRSASVGLVIVESTAVRDDGRLVPDSPGLWTDDQVPGMARLLETIKAGGAQAVIQLNHAGARGVPQEGSLLGASPSGVQFRSDIETRPLTGEQISQMVEDFASAARRAVDAGFDGVEVHGAHFYLLSQFLSPYTNQRADLYGGDLEGRARFPLEVVKAVRQTIGPQRALLYRLNAVEQVFGDEVLPDTVEFCRMLAASGVDLLDVSYAGPALRQEHESGKWQLVMSSALTKKDAAGANLGQAEKLKKASGLPVIAVGKMAFRPVINAALERGLVDLIAIGRQMIADPSAAEKILSNRFEDIVTCQECFKCFSAIRKGEPMKCAVWP